VPTPAAQEAEPDVDHLRDLMWQVYEDLGEAAAKGRLAAKEIPARRDWSTVLRALGDTLDGLGVDVPALSG
jgi:hypothetical protein